MAPDLRRKVDATRVARLVREAEMKKQADAQVSLGSFSFSFVLKNSYTSFLEYFFMFLINNQAHSWFRPLLFSKTSVIPTFSGLPVSFLFLCASTARRWIDSPLITLILIY